MKDYDLIKDIYFEDLKDGILTQEDIEYSDSRLRYNFYVEDYNFGGYWDFGLENINFED